MDCRLGDVATTHHGYAFKSTGFVDQQPEMPVIVKPGMFRESGGFNLGYGRIQCFVGDYPARFVLTPGALVVVMTCQTQGGEILGVPARIPDDGRQYLHNQRIGRVTCSPRLDEGFAYWLLNDWGVRGQLVQTASGSTVLHTSPSRIAECTIRLPPLEEQRRVAATLDALEDKIESNERRCALHAEMIDAMFSHHVLERDVSNDTEADLTSIARFVNGGAFTKGATGTGRPVLRIKELNSGISNATVFNDLDVKDEHVARHHDLLFSWSGSLDDYRWHGPEALINQHIFKVLPRDGLPVWFVQGWIRHHLPEFR
ncbi:MAG TPA: restriction endonuclease subunit S, partial [Conexibacter sp.]